MKFVENFEFKQKNQIYSQKISIKKVMNKNKLIVILFMKISKNALLRLENCL